MMTCKFLIVANEENILSVQDSGILTYNQMNFVFDVPQQFKILAQADTSQEANRMMKFISENRREALYRKAGLV